MNEDKPEKMPPVPPFVRFVASAVPMVFDDSLSYYEALCALWKYVQGMTDVINNNATLEEEYILKFNELKSYVENYFENLDVQEEINNKLDQMVEDGDLQEIIEFYFKNRFHKASDLGLSETNTEAVALENYELLKEALEGGYNVIIDGNYPLKNSVVGNSIQLTSDVILEGLDNCSIYNYDDHVLYLFDETEADLDMEKLTITNSYNSEIYVIHNDSTNTTTAKYGNIKFNDSNVEGNVRLIYITNDEANLNTEGWGLQNIDIINNNFENVGVNVCHITDTPHGVINVFSNNIHNFRSVFFRTSHYSDATDTNIEKLRCLNVDGNYVKNDDNWFTDSGTYAAFIVTKCYEVNVTNNHIEGIKSNDASVAVYPAYLSGIFVNFKNNECINNINFASNNYNYLIKAKDGNGYKTYENNTFTLDQTWLASINAGFATVYTTEQLATNTTVAIYHNDHSTKRWIIKGNKINVGRINNYSAAKNIDNFIFENNIISCTYMNGYLFRPKTGVTQYCSISGNEFYISDGSSITDAGILISSNDTLTADIKINKNKFIINQKCLPIIGIEGSLNSLEALDNIYINNYSSTYQSGKKTYSVKANAKCLNISGKLTYANAQPTMQYMIGGNDVNVDTDIVTQGLGNADTTAEMIVFTPETTKSYVIELNYLKTDSKVSEYYVVKFTRSGSSNYITFLDNADSTSKTVELVNPGSNTNYYVKDGEGGTSHLQLYLPASGDLRLRLAGALLTDNHFCNMKIHNI